MEQEPTDTAIVSAVEHGRSGRLTRRWYMLGMVAGGAALAACGPLGGQPAKQLESATIEFSYAVDAGFDVLMQKNIGLFEAAQPRVKVRGADDSGLGGLGQTQKVLTQLAADTPPDITYFTTKQFPSYTSINALLELDPLIAKDRAINYKDIYPVTVEYSVHKGKVFGLPYLFAGGTCVVFNKTLFQRRGAKTPDQYEKEGKWTWDTLLEVARQLTGGSGDDKTFGITPPFVTGIDVSNIWMWPMGADFFDKELKRSLLTSPESIAAHRWMGELYTRHRVAPLPTDLPRLNVDSGRIGMSMGARLNWVTFDRADFEKGMGSIPKGKAGRPLRATPHSAGVLKATKHPEAAYEFVKFLTTADPQRTWMGWPGGVPVRKSIAESGEFEKGLRPWESAAFYRDSFKEVRVTRLPVRAWDMDPLLTQAQGKIRSGELAAEAALTEIKPLWESLLAASQ